MTCGLEHYLIMLEIFRNFAVVDSVVLCEVTAAPRKTFSGRSRVKVANSFHDLPSVPVYPVNLFPTLLRRIHVFGNVTGKSGVPSDLAG